MHGIPNESAMLDEHICLWTIGDRVQRLHRVQGMCLRKTAQGVQIRQEPRNSFEEILRWFHCIFQVVHAGVTYKKYACQHVWDIGISCIPQWAKCWVPESCPPPITLPATRQLKTLKLTVSWKLVVVRIEIRMTAGGSELVMTFEFKTSTKVDIQAKVLYFSELLNKSDSETWLGSIQHTFLQRISMRVLLA